MKRLTAVVVSAVIALTWVASARGVDMLVVACNTASAVALPALREKLAIPVLGVVEPGARAAVQASQSGRIGVIGTMSTIASGAYQRAIRALRPEADVVARACPLLVPLAEEGWTDPDDEVVRAVARRSLAPLAQAGIDALVLGCTHYPLLKGAVAKELPGVALVDSAEAIASEVGERLRSNVGGSSTHRFFVTDTPDRFLIVAERFLGRAITSAEQIDI